MGISANQARLMTLTARQHDLELRAQQISAEKMIKGLESQEAAMDYSTALNNYTLLKRAYDEQINAMNAYYNDGARIRHYFVNNDGTFIHNDDVNGNRISYETYAPGQLVATTSNLYSKTCRVLNIPDVRSITPDEYLQREVVEYNEFTTSISSEEKLLDMELTQINTEHNAVKTEYDSVKGLVGENVDKSFNVFG